VDHNFFAPTAAGKAWRLCEKKKRKKNRARKAAKPQRPPAGRPVILRLSAAADRPLREDVNSIQDNSVWVSVYNEYFFH
jgi:hypothetical protein